MEFCFFTFIQVLASFVIGCGLSQVYSHVKTKSKLKQMKREIKHSFSIPLNHKVMITCVDTSGDFLFDASEKITIWLSPMNDPGSVWSNFYQKDVDTGRFDWELHVSANNRHMLQFFNKSNDSDCEVVITGLKSGYVQSPQPWR